MYDWLSAHALQIAATLAVVNALLRMIPASMWANLEANWPRISHFARVLRAAGPDIVKTAKSLWGIWTGMPWPSALSTIEDAARASVVPPKPIAPKPPPLPLLMCLALLVGCSAQMRRDTSVAIQHAGPAVGEIVEAHRETYIATRDALALTLRARGATQEQYLAALAPMSAEFDERSKALAALNTRLVEAAAVLDATRDTAGAQEAAHAALGAWQDALDVLGSGDVLPPVPVPSSVRAVIVELTRLVNVPVADAQMEASHG